jgi:hypothetical protein
MFAFDESLTDSGLDYEALRSRDEDGSSGPVSQLSITNWRDEWLIRKEQQDNRTFFQRVSVANRQKRRKASGLCISCGGAKDGRRSRCTSCRTNFNAYFRQRRRNWLLAGMCTYCGNKEPQAGHLTCADCSAKMARLARNKRKKIRSKRVNPAKPVPNQIQRAKRAKDRRWYRKRRASGCFTCHGLNDNEPRMNCKRCAAEYRRKRAEYRLKKKEQKLREKFLPHNGSRLEERICEQKHQLTHEVAG